MLKKITDLHIHSKYSRACSKELELPKIAEVCEKKGIDIISTADFTHPLWFKHIKESLEEVGNTGLYKLKEKISKNKIKFILGTEISCIFKDKNKVRRLHLLILSPNILSVEKFNKELEKRGVNLKSDGRPIMGLHAKEVLKILLNIDKRFIFIPAHAWTPWFAIFGSKSGYDSLEECFEELTPHIKAIETGLSSDPSMNHCLSILDKITLVSNSDAHSLEKLGREANVFSFKNEREITFNEIKRIIETGDKKRFLYTIEFFPQEGKYYFDGHLNCGISFSPSETRKHKNICPKCKKELVVGVLSRVEKLADRKRKDIDAKNFIPHNYIVPLKEIIGNIFSVGSASKKVKKEYDYLLEKIGSEFYILLEADIEKIKKEVSDKKIAIAIKNMRNGKVKVSPGYDGKFGEINFL